LKVADRLGWRALNCAGCGAYQGPDPWQQALDLDRLLELAAVLASGPR
jgi:hypothetical protein